MSSSRQRVVRLAVIGTGGMAGTHAQHFLKNPACRIVAACDVDPGRLRAYADTHGIAERYADTRELLAHAEVDAVSVVTPDAFHAPVSLLCLKAGKHVLCEKPLALDHRQAQRMVNAAHRAGVVNMVNFTYRDWPCIQGAARAVRRGDIGEVRHVEASYFQGWLASRLWGDWRKNPSALWRLSSAHGSKGVLGDIGVHIVDYATFPCGPIREVYCRLRAFPKAPGNRVGEYVLDANDSAVLNVEFANGALGTIHTSRWVGGHANRLALKIAGTRGTLSMDSEISTTSYNISNGKGLDRGGWREVACGAVPTNFQRFISAVRSGNPGGADFARGAEIQRILDACFESDRRNRPVRIAARDGGRG